MSFLRIGFGTILLVGLGVPIWGAPAGTPSVQSFAMPRYFEPNWGVADPAFQYVSRGAPYQAMFTKESASFVRDGTAVQLRFEGAGPFRYEAAEPFASKSHYIAQKISNVPHYGRLRARQIYPGIDIEFYPKDGEIEFDLIVAPGADPGQIRMTFPGAGRVAEVEGALLVYPAKGGVPLRLKMPEAHQRGRLVGSGYRVDRHERVRFDLGPYDPSIPLVIDPVLSYMTFDLCTDCTEQYHRITADASAVYIAGATRTFPMTPGAFKTEGGQAFVAKFSTDGGRLIYATYLGGNAGETKVVLSPAGEVYVLHAGSLPLTPGALSFSGVGGTIVRLNETGSAATLIMADFAQQLAIDSNGDMVQLIERTVDGDGTENSIVTPKITPGAYNQPNGTCQIIKVNRAGTTMLWSLRYGGNLNCNSLALDSQNRIWVSGVSNGVDTPITPNALWNSRPSSIHGILGRISSDGARLEYSTYLPNLNLDNNTRPAPMQVITGLDDDLYLRATSSNVAGSPGAYLRSSQGHPTFVLRLSSAGALRYITFLPVSLVAFATTPIDMFADSSGNLTVVGPSRPFGERLETVTPDALARDQTTGYGYLLTMSAAGSELLYSSYLPSAIASAGGISGAASDNMGNLYYAGVVGTQLLVPTLGTVVRRVAPNRQVNNGYFGKINLSQRGPSCVYNLLVNPGSLLATSGGTGQLTVLTDADCPWLLSGITFNNAPIFAPSQFRVTSAPNLAIGEASGIGPSTVTFTYDSRLNEPNPDLARNNYDSRFDFYGFYTTAERPTRLTVTQPLVPCAVLTLAPASVSSAGIAGSAATDLDLPPACTWTATSSAPWLTLSRTSGAGGGRLSFTLATNPGALRTGTITITTAGPAPNITRTLFVNQAGDTSVPTLALSLGSGTFPATTSTGTVDVLTQPGINWNAYTNASWVTITAGATGTGPGSVSFSLLANPATTPRTALLTIGGQLFTVSQLGQACLFGLTPTSTVLPATGGTSAITVGVTGSTCPFTATTTAPWIAIASTTATSISFTAGANPGASERTGTIRIADQAFTVTQAGAACTYSLTQSTQTFFATAGSVSTTLVTPGGCPWVAGSVDPWVTITSPASNTGPGAVTFNVAANPNPSRRTTSLFLGGQNFIVVQAGTNEGSCTASVPSVPSIDADGITERTGELLLSCTAVAAPVTTDLELTLNTPVTNALPDAALALNGIAPRLVAPNRLRWSGLTLPAGASVLRVSTLRVNASFLGRPATFQANPILATLGFSVPLTITNSTIPLAQASKAIAFSSNAFVRPEGSALAAGLILFRETRPNAVQPGARLRAVISNIPNGAELLLPVTPADGSARARLLSAAADGTGGTAVAGNRLNNTYALTPVTNGSAIATWEVLIADPLLSESFDFQILLNNALPVDLPGLRFLGSPAPVSEVLVSSTVAPPIRYRNPASSARRSALRLSSRIVSTTPATSGKVGAPRALFIAGSRVVIEATVANPAETGQPAAPNARILGNLPAGLTLRSCPAPCAPVNGQPTFPLGNVAAGQSTQVTLEAEVGPGLADGTPLSFFASATSDEPPTDLAVSSTSTTILVGGVPLSLVLTPANLTVPGTAGTAQLQLTTAFSKLAWTATVTSGASWLTISNPAGNGSAALNVRFPANPAGSARQATVAVGNATVTITQHGAPPSVAATGPVAGNAATQTFTFRFTHPEGFQNLGVLNVLINRALDGGRACYLAYSQPAGVLFLVNDNGPDAGLSAPLVLGSSANVSNSQCQINGTGSSAVGSGNLLTLTLNIAFRPGFAGNQVVYLAARDQGTGNSGWSTMGFHQVPGAPVTFPNAVGMSPATGSAATGTLTLTYEDQASANNIQTAWALMNTALDGRSGCYVAYFAPGNILFLFPDDGGAEGLTNMVLAGSSSIENSQCRISAQGSSVVRNGARLTLNLNMTFKPAFAGPKAVWLALQTLTAVTAPWKVGGAWQVPE